jgi:hypothetical protein
MYANEHTITIRAQDTTGPTNLDSLLHVFKVFLGGFAPLCSDFQRSCGQRSRLKFSKISHAIPTYLITINSGELAGNDKKTVLSFGQSLQISVTLVVNKIKRALSSKLKDNPLRQAEGTPPV